MPRTAEQFEVIRQDARHKILEAAFELFSRKGFHATSVSMIAEQAGISKGLMYNYFGGKDDLLKAIVLEFFEQGGELVEEVLASDRSAWQKLEALVRMSFNLVVERPEQCRLLFGLSMQEAIWGGIRSVLQQKMRAYLEILTPLLEALQVDDPPKEMIYLVSILDGYSMHMVTMKDDLVPNEVMIEYIIEQLKHKYEQA
jgi:AcrR family transcriptional regulator